MELKFQVKIKIQRPVAEVFDAVYNPEKLSGYFTNGGASGPLDPGATVEWRFADNPGQEPIAGNVTVTQMVPNELIVFEWMGGGDHLTQVGMIFKKAGEHEAIIEIGETGWRDTQEDLDRSYGNCFGWSGMICGLKAYLEYGVDLRKGAFGGLY